MTDLIACISTGKGTWGHVQRIIEAESWNKIFLICNTHASENFTLPQNAEKILIDPVKPIPEIEADIKKQLEHKIADTQVAINFVSGEGKEHMALLSAILKLGLGVRLIALTKDGVKEL